MRTYTGREIAERLRGIEAYASSRPMHEQVLGMDAAILRSVMQQAALMLTEYRKPAMSANRPLTLEELLTVYDADEQHAWPNNTPPFLFLEDRAGMSHWASWQYIQSILEGTDAGMLKKADYLIAWRLWLCKPTEEDCQSAPWE